MYTGVAAARCFSKYATLQLLIILLALVLGSFLILFFRTFRCSSSPIENLSPPPEEVLIDDDTYIEFCLFHGTFGIGTFGRKVIPFGWTKAKVNNCSYLGRSRGINSDIRCKQRTDSARFDFDTCTLCIFSILTMRNRVVERLRGTLSLNTW